MLLLTGSFIFHQTAYSQVQFIENQGQWAGKGKYKASLINGDLWVTDSGLLFSLWDAEASAKLHDKSLNDYTLNRHAFYLHFKGGNMSRISQRGNPSSEYYNYFLGNNPKHWKTGLFAYGELFVTDLYPGVDLQIFSHNGNLKYNLICRNPASLSMVRMQYIGVDQMQVLGNKIEIHTSVQDFTDAMPLVFGETDGVKEEIKASYLLNGNEIAFQLPANVQSRYSSITVDPVLVFSTYSGSRADNFGCTGTYDYLGNGYSGGTVFGVGFPVTLGAFQSVFRGGVTEALSYGGGRDAGILKYSPDGKSLLFCTLLGGTLNEQPHSMVADGNGNLYVMGSTRSTNFPISANAFDQTHNGDYDFFVAHLSADGKNLLGATFLGGSGMDASGADRQNNSIEDYPLFYNYADEFRGEILTDGKNVYVSGVTFSSNFPVKGNSSAFGGKEDGVVFSLSKDLNALNWSHLVGSSEHDALYGIALGKHNDIYAAGGTTGTNMQSVFPKWLNAYQGGIADAMVVRIDLGSGTMLSGRYIGTDQYEQAYFAQTDNAGNPYFYGQTEGSFPIINSPFNQPNRGQFIVRLDSQLATTTLSTSFGANSNQPNISPTAFLVDQCERIFISGWGGETNRYVQDAFTNLPKNNFNTGTTKNLIVTADAQQKTTDGSDFYIAVFSKNMYSLLYATYFGGIGSITKGAEEHVDGGTSRFDKKGIIYQSVCAGCQRNGLFPTTPGAYSRTNNSNNCNNALFKIDFENLNKKPGMRDTFLSGVATDVFALDMQANDPDPFDSLNLSYTITKTAGSNGTAKPIIQVVKGMGKAWFKLAWATSCDNYSTDTFSIRVMVFDKGCPKPDTTYATIKILVTEPPRVIPPEAICVSFDRATDQLQIAWPATTQDARFFSHFLLKRKDFNGVISTMLRIDNTQAGSFTDLSAVTPSTNNYCYWMEGYNTCNAVVIAQNPFCTVQELNNPINGVEVKFATVENDKRVKVSWQKSQEPDFKEYEIYRYKRGTTPGKLPIAYLTDSTFYDSSFDVDVESNCYSVIVTDKCGHASFQSNKACNVVIGGKATGRPDYYFDLAWQDYEDWPGGVAEWNLERQYDTKPWTLIANAGLNRTYRDAKLDYDWGGYWYRVTATEQVSNTSRAPYQSQSNWTYLYQPPELWVPNAFTANDNGINDIWGTVPVFVRNYNMKVYNRWGQKVWESDAKKRQWDGYIDGKLAEDGVFAWYVVFDGWDDKTYTMKGTVTIIH